jgi:hypothetical protein
VRLALLKKVKFLFLSKEKEMNLDQFYTKDDVAESCYTDLYQRIDVDKFDVLVEPSAGCGAFFKLLPENKREGLDIEPKYSGVVKMDFFAFKFQPNKEYLVIGNPPFGRVCSQAVKFFNHAAQFAKVIAFIIPRTFKRVSLQNQLNLNFQVIFSKDLPLKPCCFEPAMNAKCCFQIWKRSDTPREIVIYPKTHPDFNFISYGQMDANNQPTPPDLSLFDFAIREYGTNCGSVITEKRLGELDFSISKESCRQDSLGKGEFVFIYTEKFGA